MTLELIALYAVIWPLFHFGAGYVAHRLPQHLFAGFAVVSRTYTWERGGRLYEGWGIRRWKDSLPEAGAFYQGGFAKRQLAGRDPGYLGRFIVETSRAEFSHWLTWALALTFFAWNPWPVGVMMVGYGAAVNLPCILIQRYNRPRLRRALAATSARTAHRNRPAFPAHPIHDQGEKQ